jgi:hypothetical protein
MPPRTRLNDVGNFPLLAEDPVMSFLSPEWGDIV